MDRILLYLLVLGIFSCHQVPETQQSFSDHLEAPSAQEPEYCTQQVFTSPKARAEALLFQYERIQTLDGEAQKDAQKNFFCAFPTDFKGMQLLFGYTDDQEAPLYEYPVTKTAYIQNYILNDLIGYFSEMTTIPEEAYYRKYINLCVEGRWEADNITHGFGLWNRLLTDTEASSRVLKTYPDKDIRSVFRFLFDGPHPSNEANKDLYEQLHTKLQDHSTRLTALLAESYRFILENETHRH